MAARALRKKSGGRVQARLPSSGLAVAGEDQNPSSISVDLSQGQQEEGGSLGSRVRQRQPLFFSNLEIIRRKLNKMDNVENQVEGGNNEVETATGKAKKRSGKKGKKEKKLKKVKMTFPCPEPDSDYQDESERSQHSGPRPDLFCQFCGSQFGSSNNLKIHINSQHLGLREVCTVCGKHFAAKAILQMHVKENHEDGTDLKCNFCDKSFSRKDYKDRHVKKAHPEV